MFNNIWHYFSEKANRGIPYDYDNNWKQQRQDETAAYMNHHHSMPNWLLTGFIVNQHQPFYNKKRDSRQRSFYSHHQQNNAILDRKRSSVQHNNRQPFQEEANYHNRQQKRRHSAASLLQQQQQPFINRINHALPLLVSSGGAYNPFVDMLAIGTTRVLDNLISGKDHSYGNSNYLSQYSHHQPYSFSQPYSKINHQYDPYSRHEQRLYMNQLLNNNYYNNRKHNISRPF
ncbi:uncharacterized protein BX663DRAFT_498326 [Cokeromyces recurvatus]|uniref:uncharacterized protein n=1 Tax=Cokeromyces recurvatus TaxID=90255 RepID=UPI00221FEDD6|nr:uncharacterized protein BX663DRAFT_498326 [Cokeromyces recurvatus]KAI7905974.1 hypothetical protein BX663DRAFT_498326 [Cokeromyces recurvatus]